MIITYRHVEANKGKEWPWVKSHRESRYISLLCSVGKEHIVINSTVSEASETFAMREAEQLVEFAKGSNPDAIVQPKCILQFPRFLLGIQCDKLPSNKP
jgi:hypothetical protein